MFTLGLKEKLIKNTFKVQDTKESYMSKSFYIHHPTTVGIRRRIKSSTFTFRKLYKDLESGKEIHNKCIQVQYGCREFIFLV